jgi:hypothetical protein
MAQCGIDFRVELSVAVSICRHSKSAWPFDISSDRFSPVQGGLSPPATPRKLAPVFPPRANPSQGGDAKPPVREINISQIAGVAETSSCFMPFLTCPVGPGAILTPLFQPTASAAVNDAPTISGAPSTRTATRSRSTSRTSLRGCGSTPRPGSWVARRPTPRLAARSPVSGSLSPTVRPRPRCPRSGSRYVPPRVRQAVRPITSAPRSAACRSPRQPSARWFKPTASDANRDPLRFSVTSKPRWLSFSASNGSLWGKPGGYFSAR